MSEHLLPFLLGERPRGRVDELQWIPAFAGVKSLQHLRILKNCKFLIQTEKCLHAMSPTVMSFKLIKYYINKVLEGAGCFGRSLEI